MLHLSIIFVLLANLAFLATAAIVPGHDQDPHTVAKRNEVTFSWDDYPVQNCSSPALGRSPPEQSILAEDCQWVRTMIRSNNGGYFELWNFDSPEYKPIVGYKTCVLAISHAVTNDSGDYAIVGNEDVANVMQMALLDFQNDGNVATITGNMTCGPNNATIGILVYNGLTGGTGGPVNATKTTMLGDAWGGETGTATPPALPSVTISPSPSVIFT